MTVLANIKEITPADSQDPIINLLNEFIKINLLDINSSMQDYIKDKNDKLSREEKFDPMMFVASGKKEEHIGTVNYTFSNLRGLLSLSISRFKIMSVEQESDKTVCIKAQIDTEVQENSKLHYAIVTDVNGYTSDKFTQIEIPYSGNITASEVTAESDISLKADIYNMKLRMMKSFDIKLQELKYSDLRVNIKGINLPDGLTECLRKHFEEETKLSIEKAVKERVNESLPICVGIDDLRKIVPIKK